MTDYPDWQTPQEHANKIAATGAPLINLYSVLAHAAPVIAANGSVSVPAIGQFNINQPAYEFILQVSTTGATASLCTVEIFWADQLTGLHTGYQKFAFYAGTAAAPHFIHGHGPTDGNLLSVTITAGANQITVSYSLMLSSRLFTKHLWQTVNPVENPPAIPGFNTAASDIGNGILLAETDVLAASGSAKYLLPLYTGDIDWTGSTTDTTAGNGAWRITAETAANLPTNLAVFRLSGQAGFAAGGSNRMEGPFSLPRGQCSHTYQNLNAGAGATLAAVILVKQEQ